jgi:phage-related protein
MRAWEVEVPETVVLLFAEANGSSPLIEWMDGIPAKARDKCIVRLERLGQQGHELRRPEADLLRDEIHELRAKLGHVNYRILYFFHAGQAVVSHGCTKEGVVPDREIDLAVQRKLAFRADPARHTYRE